MTATIEAMVGVPTEVDLGRAPEGTLIDVEVADTRTGTPPMLVPAFQGADGHVRVRFAAPTVGTYELSAPDLHGTGATLARIVAAPYEGPNALYRYGRLRVAADGRTLEHADGAPFLWLGDTWWMGLTTRLDWPAGLRRLLDDRVAKGFSVIQVVAGPLPDFAATPEGIWHPQQANEGGWSWERGWTRINPAFFDHADRRIRAIVEAGIVPCIVGMWAYYEHAMGAQRIRRHWRELVARYAAYPVVLCVAGEVNLPGYDVEAGRAVRDARRVRQLETWTAMARELHHLDPFDNLVTAHPGSPDGRSLLTDPGVLDVNMVQTSHWSYHEPPEAWRRELGRDIGLEGPIRMGFTGMLDIVRESVGQEPAMPVINAEPCYEGILGGNWQDVQRFNFWTGWLSGLAGFTYGADGIWQMSSEAEAFANHASRWGGAPWQRAMHHEGARQVAAGAGLLRGLPWWTLRPVASTRAEAAGRVAPYGAASDERSIHYLPSILVEERLRGMRDLPIDVPPRGPSRARFVDPSTMAEHPVGPVQPDADGTWRPPEPPTYADWLLIVEPEGDLP
jgi:hypothetical protein